MVIWYLIALPPPHSPWTWPFGENLQVFPAWKHMSVGGWMPFKNCIASWYHLPRARRPGGAGDRYFLQGACCTVPTSSWPLRGTCNPPPNLIYISPSSRKKGGTRITWPTLSRMSPDWSSWPCWVTWVDRERTPVFVLPDFAESDVRVRTRAFAVFTCCSFSGSGHHFFFQRNFSLSMVVISSRIMRCTQSRFLDSYSSIPFLVFLFKMVD